MFGGEYGIEFDEACVTQQSRWKFAAHRGEIVRCGKDRGSVGHFIIHRPRYDDGRAVQETHHCRYMEDVLVESCKQEQPVLRHGTADGAAKLMLAIDRSEIQHAVVRVYLAVAQVVERCAM